MRDDLDSGVGTRERTPPRPVSEETIGHAGQCRGSKPDTCSLINAPSGAHVADRPRADSGTDTSVEITRASIKTTRASCRFRIYASSIVEDPEAAKAHQKRKCNKKTCTACAFIRTLYDTQRAVAGFANLLIRKHWQIDANVLDDFRLAHQRTPTSEEWPFAKFNGYKLGRLAYPEIASGIASQVTQNARSKWMSDRYAALVRCEKSPPHYRDTGPIPIRKQEVGFVCVKGNEYAVSFILESGRGKRITVPLTAKDKYQRDLLRELADPNGNARHADIKIERDRKKRWHLRIGYKRRVFISPEGGTAAINRGMRTFLAAVTHHGRTWMYDGNDIEEYLRRLWHRRKRIQNDSCASGRNGHGRTRMLAPLDVLEDKGKRWRQTKCQTIARRFSCWLQRHGITTLYVEDFTGIRHGLEEKLDGGKYVWDRIQTWPYYQLQQRLVSCCEEIGITVYQTSACRISMDCPSCGKEATPDRRHWKLCCSSCGYRRHLDLAAATNVHTRGEAAKNGDGKGIKRLTGSPEGVEDTPRKTNGKRPKNKPNGKNGRN